jgi:hypothetical protein
MLSRSSFWHLHWLPRAFSPKSTNIHSSMSLKIIELWPTSLWGTKIFYLKFPWLRCTMVWRGIVWQTGNKILERPDALILYTEKGDVKSKTFVFICHTISNYVDQLNNKFATFHGNWKSITLFKTAHHSSLSWAKIM